MKQELFRKLVKEEIKTVLKEIKKSLKTPKLRENNKKEIRFDLVMSDEAYDGLFDLIARYVEDPDDVEKELDRYDEGGFDSMSNIVTANLDRDKDYIAWKKKYGIKEGKLTEAAPRIKTDPDVEKLKQVYKDISYMERMLKMNDSSRYSHVRRDFDKALLHVAKLTNILQRKGPTIPEGENGE